MIATETDAALRAHERGVHLIDYLRSRGYAQDFSDEDGLRTLFTNEAITGYVGFDPTAASLHVGHLLSIMVLGTLQRFGHRPIALAGGGTAMVGDPTGKTATRAVLSPAEIESNLQIIIRQFDRYIDFKGGRFGDRSPAALLVNNADWLLELKYIEFLRDIGRHFSVNEMLAAETYKVRLESTGLNFVEFNYRIVQAYDFLHLFRTLGCRLQMGGSDQWGNIVAGVDLIRRVEGAQAFAVVTPLITTSSGEKMGKSEGNSLWLDPSMTTPFDYYQYWINRDDAEVRRLLLLYTFLPDDFIDELTSVTGADLREAKRVLAYHSTALTHGSEVADRVDSAARAAFGQAKVTSTRRVGATAVIMDPGLPLVTITRSDADSMTIAELCVRSGLCSSRNEARRLAQQGGLVLDDQRVPDGNDSVPENKHFMILRVGKKKLVQVEVID